MTNSLATAAMIDCSAAMAEARINSMAAMATTHCSASRVAIL